MKLKSLAIAMLTACTALIHIACYAQPYPNKAITIVVPFTAGSTTDGLARAIGNEIAKEIHQPVLVDNRAGASGAIAAQFVAQAAPDGYTIFLTTNTTQSANQFLFKKLPYDATRDFAPIAALVKGYLMMVTNPNVPANSVAELIALAKKNPGKLSFAAGSSSARVAVEQFQQMTGTQLLHVPYKANPQAIVDLVGGQVDMMIVDLATSLPQAKAGKLRALGVSSPQRLALAPELPTIEEAGVRGYEFSFWNAAYAPAKTPDAIIKRLNELMVKAVNTESVRKFVGTYGMEPYTTSPADLAVFQAAEIERWGRIIKTAGIQPE